jgi:hypothetical protein
MASNGQGGGPVVGPGPDGAVAHGRKGCASVVRGAKDRAGGGSLRSAASTAVPSAGTGLASGSHRSTAAPAAAPTTMARIRRASGDRRTAVIAADTTRRGRPVTRHNLRRQVDFVKRTRGANPGVRDWRRSPVSAGLLDPGYRWRMPCRSQAPSRLANHLLALAVERRERMRRTTSYIQGGPAAEGLARRSGVGSPKHVQRRRTLAAPSLAHALVTRTILVAPGRAASDLAP